MCTTHKACKCTTLIASKKRSHARLNLEAWDHAASCSAESHPNTMFACANAVSSTWTKPLGLRKVLRTLRCTKFLPTSQSPTPWDLTTMNQKGLVFLVCRILFLLLITSTQVPSILGISDAPSRPTSSTASQNNKATLQETGNFQVGIFRAKATVQYLRLAVPSGRPAPDSSALLKGL